jgi:hypothetical protein
MDFSFQGRHPPFHLAAMAANTSVLLNDEPWYADSGANQNITSELDNLTLQQSYSGNETVSVGNGAGLLIANAGSSFFNTLSSSLCLKNILHCPNASANLLSIQRFFVDNNCHFILTAFEFWVKDNLTGIILLHHPSEGLYPVHLKQFSRNKGPRLFAFIGIKTTWPIWHFDLAIPLLLFSIKLSSLTVFLSMALHLQALSINHVKWPKVTASIPSIHPEFNFTIGIDTQ